ncbi:MAG: anthranilate phosphoribosyltransferase [Phycisphaerae bacterium]|jgi:anthranilate phosphoribosyltransferase|nr:anthranilate phosphoribosyltransferase [Phycisphaerae bacterium]
MTDDKFVYSELLSRVVAGSDLSREQAYWAFMQIMGGQWTPAQIAAVLTALAAKGETVDEITAAAQAMRDHAVKIDTAGLDVIDTCGTGGTGLKTFNISTTAALVLAGAGAKVAKHGNRTNTRSSGSADVLEALGVNLDAGETAVAESLKQAGVCFCYARLCHPAMKHAGPIRRELGVRTIFNVLGPLTNPAGAKRQLMGVFSDALTEPIANVLANLGAERVMVVHAADGLDEISTTSETRISQFDGEKVTTKTITPEEFGVARANMDDLLIDSPEASADVIRTILGGQSGPARDIVLLNAAAGLFVAGKADDMQAGLAMAAESIDSGAAAGALEKLIAATAESSPQ